MKKILMFLILLIMVTGCSTISKTSNYTKYIENVLNNSNSDVNKTSIGYKYYLPDGVILKSDIQFNQEFTCLNTSMYLYVDISGYYYRKVKEYKKETDDYYFDTINYNSKNGYIRVKKQKNDFYVEILYNYAKIELYTSEYYLKDVVTYATIILSSITYNDTIVNNIIHENYFSSIETEYKLKKPNTENKETFEQYQEEYNVYNDENVLPDEKKVNNEKSNN